MSYKCVQNSDGTVAVVNRITGTTVISFDAADAVTFSGQSLDAMTREALAATGTDAATGATVSKQMTAVTASDGTKAVTLPAAATTTGPLYIVNTVQTAALNVYPVSGGNDGINAGGANVVFTMGPGKAGWFIPTSGTQWYVVGDAAITSTPTELSAIDGVTSSAAEINYLDITTLGTGAASKAVVLDAGDDYTWPATGILTYGVLKDPAGTSLGATVAEINAVADVSARVVSAAGASLAVTAALHGGRIIAFDQTGGTTATLPAATGTGNVYHFIVKVKNTSSANKIAVADATDLFQGQIINTDADAAVPVSYTANVGGDVDTISLNGTTTGGQIGDWIEVVDIASNVYAVRGFVVCPAGSNVATPLLTGQVS